MRDKVTITITEEQANDLLRIEHHLYCEGGSLLTRHPSLGRERLEWSTVLRGIIEQIENKGMRPWR